MSESRITPLKVKTVTATSTLTVDDMGLILIANTGAVTINLPSAADCAIAQGTFKGFIFKKTTADAFAATIDPSASQTIDGASTHTAMDAQYDTITIYPDGSNWHKTAQIIA